MHSLVTECSYSYLYAKTIHMLLQNIIHWLTELIVTGSIPCISTLKYSSYSIQKNINLCSGQTHICYVVVLFVYMCVC